MSQPGGGGEGSERVAIDVGHFDSTARERATALMRDAGIDVGLAADSLTVPANRIDVAQDILEQALDFDGNTTYAAEGIAPPWRRFVGNLVESVMFGSVGWAAYAATGSSDSVRLVTSALLVLNGVVAVATAGRTLGMAATGTRVVRPPDPGVPNWSTAIVRWVVSMGPALLSWVIRLVSPEAPAGLWWALSVSIWVWDIIVFGPILFDRLNRGLHDRAARTVVVLNDYHGDLDYSLVSQQRSPR